MTIRGNRPLLGAVVTSVVGVLLTGCGTATGSTPRTSSASGGASAVPVSAEIMSSLGACVIDSVVGGGSTPTSVKVYATTWNQASRAVGGLPLTKSGDGAAFVIWVTGDLKSQYDQVSPSPSGRVTAIWLVEPAARPTAIGSPGCAGRDSGEVSSAFPVDLGVLGPGTVMPPSDYSSPPPSSSP